MSVIKLLMNLLTGKARQKKFVRFIPSVFPNDKILYIIFVNPEKNQGWIKLKKIN